MSTEIELKYLILSEDVSAIIFRLIKEHKISFTHQIKTLSNCYFDTQKLAFRGLDMGLRVRTFDGHIEQTIKTSGVVIGGLHQRPEYNVTIASTFPQLSLFPLDIWPEVHLVEKLQSELIPLFNTNFTRETWLITLNESEIELAFDQGTIISDGDTLGICELELELVSGYKDALFSLAKLLFSTLSLRPGIKSKAARGYQLYSKKVEDNVGDLVLDINSKATDIKGCFVAGISHSLQLLQQGVEQYLQNKTLVKFAELIDVLALLRQGFWLFDPTLTDKSKEIRNDLSYFIQLFSWVDNAIYLQELMNKTGNYRGKLNYSAQLIAHLKIENKRFPDHHMIEELLHSERFNLLQLKLLTLITSHNQHEYFIHSNNKTLLDVFIKEKLSESLQSLTHGISSSHNAEQYLAQRQTLNRCLLTGHWFGCFFNRSERVTFLIPWQDIQEGLSELQSLWIIKQQLEKVDYIDESNKNKIVSWQEGKVENLLLALSQSKKAALSHAAYWQG